MVSELRAAKVAHMFVILGVLAGVAVAIGPLSFLKAAVDGVAVSLVSATASAVSQLLRSAPFLDDHEHLVEVFAVALAVAVPGAVALGLILVARAAATMRRAVTAAALLAACASFAVLPAAQAVLLLVFVLLAGGLAVLVEGAVVAAPLAALATVLTVRFVVLIWTGSSSEVVQGSMRLAELSGTGSASAAWQAALTVVALAPFAAAARAVMSTK